MNMLADTSTRYVPLLSYLRAQIDYSKLESDTDVKDMPMKTWLPERDLYLDELIRREGRGDFRAEKCSFCPENTEGDRGKAIFRCLDCSPAPLSCDQCLCRRHKDLPYHRVQVRLLYL